MIIWLFHRLIAYVVHMIILTSCCRCSNCSLRFSETLKLQIIHFISLFIYCKLWILMYIIHWWSIDLTCKIHFILQTDLDLHPSATETCISFIWLHWIGTGLLSLFLKELLVIRRICILHIAWHLDCCINIYLVNHNKDPIT